MTKYEYYINKADYYTREALKHYGRDNNKCLTFAIIAQDYKEKALKLPVGKALKLKLAEVCR